MASGDFKVLPKRTTSDKLRDEASNNAKNTKYDGYQRGLASMVYKFFDKKSALGVAIKNNHILNQCPSNSAEELHKPIIKKFEKHKVYSSCKDNVCGADLADTQLMSKLKKNLFFIMCYRYFQ